MKDQQRTQRFRLGKLAKFRPDVPGRDDAPCDQGECNTSEKGDLRVHKILLLRLQPLWAAACRRGFAVIQIPVQGRVGDTVFAPPDFRGRGELRMRWKRTAKFAVVASKIETRT